MAVKHVKEYYDQVCNQYIEMNQEIREFQKEVEEGLIEPERIDNLKKVIEPLKNNYMTLSWIMYLLNKPQKDSKGKSYERRTKKFRESLDKSFDKKSILKQNEDVIKSIGGVWMYLKKFLEQLGITQVGHYTKSNSYIIDIEDSNEYGKIYSLLDKSDEVEEDDDSSTITIHNSNIVFESEEYQFTLIADFDQDTYKLVCKEF